MRRNTIVRESLFSRRRKGFARPDHRMLIKVGKKVSLGKVLGSPGVEIVDVVVRINVLLKTRAAE